MSKLDGINPDEQVFHRIRCTYQKFKGELVITDKGIIFLKSSGMLGTRRERMHYFVFDEIHGIRTEKKGLFGYYIALDHRTLSWGNRTYRYACSQQDANVFLGAIDLQKSQLKVPEETESLLLSLIKPKGEADLVEISKNPKVRSIVARLYNIDQRKISDIQVFNTVKDIVIQLISKGNLEGIITDENRYISNVMLARKTVQYQVVVDFASIYSQLENKGIVLQTLECPSCNGKLEYPKNGDEIICQFCGAAVHAVDVFKKFKDML
ncbi:MAG: PH domain-containing protein [Candidatus Thorarchaeota archaeon]